VHRLQVLCAKKPRHPEKLEPGIYIYKEDDSETICALIVHFDKQLDTMNVSQLDPKNEHTKKLLSLLPQTDDEETRFELPFVSFIRSHCQRIGISNLAVVKLLLESGADINASHRIASGIETSDYTEASAPLFAILGDYPDILEVLLKDEFELDLNRIDADGHTLLNRAINSKQIAAVQAILDTRRVASSTLAQAEALADDHLRREERALKQTERKLQAPPASQVQEALSYDRIVAMKEAIIDNINKFKKIIDLLQQPPNPELSKPDSLPLERELELELFEDEDDDYDDEEKDDPEANDSDDAASAQRGADGSSTNHSAMFTVINSKEVLRRIINRLALLFTDKNAARFRDVPDCEKVLKDTFLLWKMAELDEEGLKLRLGSPIPLVKVRDFVSENAVPNGGFFASPTAEEEDDPQQEVAECVRGL